ncbi:hypothetical protein [Listeria rustica]|uniref:Uncharacterized protein n=1 Tax=Listeria rustica TaxID=2713503 RepID=A0A7W1T595_9LIST|nr:hypothetical protein [Listeria rustica]MBA3925720.1 hypothetical protein [Listeria rustica]
MTFFKKLFGGISNINAQKMYGTVDDWIHASPNEIKRYRENIMAGVQNKAVPPGMLGSFLMVLGEGEAGEKILSDAIADNLENADKDYSESLSYYYVHHENYNAALKQNKWFKKWIDSSEKCVQQGQKNAESRLADIYDTCYSIKDKEFENIVGRIIELYEVATAKHQSLAALNYGSFIKNELSSTDFKKRSPQNYRPLEDSEPYLIQAVQDEKGTDFEDSACNILISFYSELVSKNLFESLDEYFKGGELETLRNQSTQIYNKGTKHFRRKNPDALTDGFQESLDNYMAHLELVILADKLRENKDFKDIADNFVWQVSKKHFPNAVITIPKDECLNTMISYFTENKQALTKDGDFSQAFYDFVDRRLAKV